MEYFQVNYAAILVAAVAKSVIGMVWYSPAVFGKHWTRLAGVTMPGKKAMWRSAAIEFLANLVMAYVLVHAVHYAVASTWVHGAEVGFFNWLGFVATVGLGMVIWERRPLKLYLINAGGTLVSLLVMGAIVATWV